MPDDLFPQQAVLGAAMLGERGHPGLLALGDADFTHPGLAAVARALRAMILRGDKPDLLTVAAEVDARGGAPGGCGSFGYLMDLQSAVPLPDNGWHYAEIVRTGTRTRAIRAASQRLADAMERPGAGESSAELLAAHTDALSAVPPELAFVDAQVPTISDLMAQKFEQRWLIPGLLARRERVVITAGEGGGKSTTLTQWAVCLAAGLHPWTGERIGDGARVLMLDAENDAEQTQHRFQWVGHRINQLGGAAGWGNRVFHQIRPEGFDIVGRDRAWLTRVVSETCPDFIALGPAYKAMGAAKTSDDAAILAFFAVLDEVRVKHDAALMIEAHSGHATDADGTRALRPFGSSVWMRWPEVGIGMRRNKDLDAGLNHATVVDLVHWRGTRGEREWPDQLNRGRDGQLPWTPARPDYWDTARQAASHE